MIGTLTEPNEGPSGRFLLTRDQTASWVEAAQSARLEDQVLRGLGDPVEGSPLWLADQAVTDYPASVWCRSFLSAAIEHMLMWADFAAPLKFHEEAETIHRLRPALTLARAAIESAAQALYVLAAPGLLDCATRHVSLVLWDLSQQSKAAMTPEAKAAIKSERGPEPIRPGPRLELSRACSEAWRKATKALGLSQFHVHDVRHASLTVAAQAGATTRELMARPGHRTTAAAMVYQRVAEERSAALAEQIDALSANRLGTNWARGQIEGREPEAGGQ